MALSKLCWHVELTAKESDSPGHRFNTDIQRQDGRVPSLLAVIDDDSGALNITFLKPCCHLSDVSWVATIVLIA
jgi:hypothetical protein